MEIISHATGQVRAIVVWSPLNGGYIVRLVPGVPPPLYLPRYNPGDEYLPDGP